MNITSCVLAVFSPTGGTRKIAEAVGKGTGLSVRTVDLCQDVEACAVSSEELLVAACPVFGGRIPAVAGERLARLQGAGGPAIAVAVYGNRAYDDALLELKDVLTAGGFTVCAAGAFIAEHSMVREIAANRPDAEDIAAAQAFGEKAVQNVRKAASLSPVEVPGSPAYKEKKAAGAFLKASAGKPKQPEMFGV